MANIPFTCKDCPNRYPGCSGKCEKYKRERAEYDRLKAKENIDRSLRTYEVERRLSSYDRYIKKKRSRSGYKRI